MAYGFNDDRSKFYLNALKSEILAECRSEIEDAIEEAIEELPSSSVDILTSTKTTTFTMNAGSTSVEKIVTFNLPYSGRTHKVIGADISATGNISNYLCSAPHISGSGNNYSVSTTILNQLISYNNDVVTPAYAGYSSDSITLTIKLNYIDID